tara:strand:- start:71 stop:274 length:204 start_codon:yes stop_codon:yes gene_type:complete
MNWIEATERLEYVLASRIKRQASTDEQKASKAYQLGSLLGLMGCTLTEAQIEKLEREENIIPGVTCP